MRKPFRIYRIICTLTDKALVSGSDYPNPSRWTRTGVLDLQWYERGSWSASGGAFWKGEDTVRKHLQALCHDWATHSAPSRWPRYEGQRAYWREVIPGPADWSRLEHLRVEQIYITNHTTTTLLASDFMGVAEERVG